MSATNLVESLRRGPAARLTLNQPEVSNAFNLALVNGVADPLGGAAERPGVRAALISGSEFAFWAGVYIKVLTPLITARLNCGVAFGRYSLASLEIDPTATIAAVRGLAPGGCPEIALACAIVAAGESSRFDLPKVKLGVTPGASGTQRAVRALGTARAIRAPHGEESIPAQDALVGRLISGVISDQRCLDTGTKIDEVVDAAAPWAVRFSKESVYRACEIPLQASLALGQRAFQLLLPSTNALEGTSGFP